MTDEPVRNETTEREAGSRAATPAEHTRDPRSLFYKIASAIQHRVLSTGDAAELRRMDPRRLDAPGFWKIAGMYLEQALPGEARARHRKESAWGAIAVALAHIGDLQIPNERLGRVLAEAGYSEQRFVSLLRSDEERLLDEVPRLARYLAAKNIRADLAGAALLLVGANPEQTRRNLARDYYGALTSQAD